MGNPFVHVELMSTDVGKAKSFYGKLFDWQLEDMDMGDMTYTMIKVGEGTGGGLMKNPMPNAPSMWVAYVNVDDVKAATGKAKSLGAKVMKDVHEVKGAGSFSIITDPTGAMLGLWQPKKAWVLRRAATEEKDMATTHDKADGEVQIRALIDDQIKAVRTKDVSGLLARYAQDVLVFDLVNPLQYRGSDALRKRAADWLSSFEGPVGYEVRDLRITAGDDVGYCHSLNRVTGTTTQGKKIDMSWRATVCCRKIDGRWMVMHGHSSVPFDMESGKASLDLKP